MQDDILNTILKMLHDEGLDKFYLDEDGDERNIKHQNGWYLIEVRSRPRVWDYSRALWVSLDLADPKSIDNILKQAGAINHVRNDKKASARK